MAQGNLLWKQPDNNGGLTPNRSKNIASQPVVPLSQFSSNSSQNSNLPSQARVSSNIPLSKANHNAYGFSNLTNMGKAGHRKYQ